MEALAPHTVAPKVHLEDNTSCLYAVEGKRGTPRAKHIEIPVCFLPEQYENGIFVPKYDKSNIMLDICTKPCSGPIIS